MRNVILGIVLFFLTSYSYSQQYEIEKLKVVATVWGETYLFHPSVIRADKNLYWENKLVEFLPSVKNNKSEKDLIANINTNLLSALGDQFTLVQSSRNYDTITNLGLKTNQKYDYLRLTDNQLSDISNLPNINTLIKDRISTKPLIIDLRINSALDIDMHSFGFFEYFLSIFIKEPIPLNILASREHFGWDEYNDWWFYQQKWNISHEDKQIKDNGKLNPFVKYTQDVQQFIPDVNIEEFTFVDRPIYFITNNSFLSYYNSLLLSFKANRKNTFIINQNSGKIFTSEFSNLTKYNFNNFEFILNPTISLSNDFRSCNYDINLPDINTTDVLKFVNTPIKPTQNNQKIALNISVNKYKETNQVLTVEEKILGVVKLWTIVRYFYVHHNRASEKWEDLLGKYLELVQKTTSDNEYYILIQKMMSVLNDSHVSTFHSSILDYSKIFVAPIKFEWIEDKVIVTAIDTSIKADLNIGDEIVAINDQQISDLLKKESEIISFSNKQGLINTVINPMYFIGENGSNLKLLIKKDNKNIDIEVPRTTYVFQLIGFGDYRDESKILDNNIGYLNLAFLNNAQLLENELIKMKNTKGLIIDLRKSYPTSDYNHFLKMLYQKQAKLRIDEVPIVKSNMLNKKLTEITEYIIEPDTTFNYSQPIVVLVDKSMISRPEDIAISLKQLPNIIFIGEQTQGTDGEITKVYLPGSGETTFTGQLVRFGNGNAFQGIGIVPDIKVDRTINGVKNNKDEILDKALEILNK